MEPLGLPSRGGVPGGTLMAVTVDRSHYVVRKLRLEDEGKDSGVANATPTERVAMVWPLTVQAWTFKEGRWDAPRLRRDVVCTLRRRG